MDLRLLSVAAAVVLAGATTAVVLGAGGGDEDGVVMAEAEPAWSGEADVSVFLCTKSAPEETPCQGQAASAQQVKTIEEELRRLPQVDGMFFENQALAYENFKRSYAHNQALLDAVKVTDLPQSFRLKIKEGGDRRQVRESVRGLAGIRDVVDRASLGTQPIDGQVEWEISVFPCRKATAMPTCMSGKNGVSQGATNAQKQAVEALIRKAPEVEKFVFEDQAMAYKNFQQAFKGNKALMQATKVEDLPESFRVTLKEDSDGTDLANKLKKQPGVAQVVYQRCLVDQLTLLGDFGLPLPEKACPVGR
ncbi:permease-like cell division protein FtsX [Nonomuraea insulae]|uniref:Permease-like cell division protein FtsX n=1 Tax=Nonomuraea insulae TaxID=1616787 RepID=A0ABW1CEI3_9ACTN